MVSDTSPSRARRTKTTSLRSLGCKQRRVEESVQPWAQIIDAVGPRERRRAENGLQLTGPERAAKRNTQAADACFTCLGQRTLRIGARIVPFITLVVGNAIGKHNEDFAGRPRPLR